jgi:hypothetical protein
MLLKSFRKMTKKKPVIQVAAALIIIVSVFFLFSTFRQTYVGACDWYAYYSQSLLLRSGQLYMPTRLDPEIFPSVAPLGYYERNGRVVPHFPPGYPLLMALFGLVGLEFYVTPVIGTLSFILMFLILSRLVNRHIALMFSLLWVLSPIVVWGSTEVMSDLVACCFILLAYYFFMKEKIALSGLVFGFSLLVRPSNILFMLVLLPLVIKQKKLFKFGVYFSIVTAVSAVYNWLMHGAPWKYGYYDTASLLSGSVFFRNFLYYSKEIVVQFTPFLLLLALIPLWKRKKQAYVYGAWFFSFFIFYCFIILGNNVWWGIRFLLPAYPALFILSALGLKEILEYAAEKWESKKAKAYIKPAVIVITILLLSYFVHFESKTLLFYKDKWIEFRDISRKAAENIPPGSVVGASVMSGPLRLYGNVESFNLKHIKSSRLIGRMLKRKRPVYLIMEPEFKGSPDFERKLAKFDYEKIVKLSEQKDYYLLRIKGKRRR